MLNSGSRLLAALLLAVGAGYGQTVSASLKGMLVDPTNAAIAGVEVALSNSDTGAQLKTTSNAEGLFVFPSVPAGLYNLAITAPGFKRQERTNVELTASEIRDLGSITLALGEVREAVTVIDTPAALQTASAEKAGLVSGEQLNELALKGRDFMSLVSIMPGIVDTSDSRETTSNKAMDGIYINGGRNESKNFTVDGVGAVDTGSNTSIHYQPNMDSIAEVKVLTSNYQAEYGRSSSGLISVVTKGGGQQFHGSGWFNYRHEQLNANSFFRNRNGTPKTPYRYDIGGYSVGGPVVIPHKFNTDRSKLFFFVSQEYTRRKVDAGTQYNNMPTALERAGDFSQSVDTNGKLIAVKDPLNGSKAFPGNIIPKDRLNPLGQSILSFFPLPNYVDSDPTLVHKRNYRATASGTHPRRNDMVRIDTYPLSKLNGYFRWIRDHDDQELPFQGYDFLYSPTMHPNPGHGYIAHITYTLRPTLLDEFSLGKSYVSWQYRPEDPSTVLRSVIGNIPQWFPNQLTTNQKSEVVDSLQMPDMSFGGTPTNPPTIKLNDQQHINNNNTWDITNNLLWVKGTHNIKAGVYVHLNDKVQVQGDAWNGSFNFGVNGKNPYNTGDGFANAALGYFDTYTESTRGINFHAKYWTTEFFIQDNWRVKRGLTFDYGVRFYHLSSQVDLNHSISSFFPQRYDPAAAPRLYWPGFDASKTRVAVDRVTGAIAPAAMIGLFVPGTGNPSNGMGIAGVDGNPWGVYSTPLLSPAPRVGFAYDPFGKGKTVIRGGMGVFLDRTRQLVMNGTVNNPPISYNPTAYYGNLSTLNDTGGLIGPSAINFAFPQKSQNPSVMSYSFGVQQMLPSKVILDVSYVGNISRHLPQARNLNPIAMYSHFDPSNLDPTQTNKPLPDNFFRPYPGYGNITTYEFASSSNYNSLQAQAQRRMTRNLRFGAAFTWAKALGVANAWNDAVSPYFDPRHRNYGPLDFDRSHMFSLNYMYTLPKPGAFLHTRILGAVTDNWTLSGITMFVSGPPFTPSFTTAANSDVTGSQEAATITVIGDPRLDKGDKTFYRNFNTAAFVATPQRSFGNAGVNILRKPGINNWDMSLSKSFPVGLGENRPLMFRAETYNTFNHTQFSNLDTTGRYDAAGRQTNLSFGAFTAARPGRVMAFSLRLRW